MLAAGCSSGGGGRRQRRQPRLTPFAHDPVRHGARLPFTEAHAAPLPTNDHLETGLLDFLLQTSFMFPQQKGFVMPPDLLIASSNSFEFLKLMTDPRMFPLISPKTQAARELYKGYATGPFRLIVVNCMGSVRHYNTLDIAFDATSDDIFQHVRVYDSLRHPIRKTTRGNNNKKNLDQVAISSTAGEYLRLLQTFLVRFCFFNNDNVLRKLKSDPTYILKNAVNEDSPQQTNVWDCGLFSSLGVALHLVNGIDIDRDIFSPDHISTFRTVLYEEFENRMTTTTGRRRASSSGGVRLRGFDGRFIYSFFPRLEALSHPLRLVSASIAGTTQYVRKWLHAFQ